ncbi:uncharacterized protein si:ch73-364h19.1 [Silurus meridionalis]|uniref:Uncharacterized protein n=1 Tax=Silurus meridionalis TaxID=175797 RepID=A0A8T0AYV2_SILME|nr:uncharacterized protein si:ch73-364h19.1 [Silurus meridionalis]KAF7698173.1 hypothetical protein HF521_004683 [Silurus meridionalis]
MFTPASLNDTFISPTSSPANTPTDQLTAVMISLSCLVVVVLLVLLGSVIYCKLPFCCKSRAYQDSHADLEPSSQHYSSRQTLVGSPCTDLPPSLETLDNINPRSGQLFYVGVSNTYCLPPMDLSIPHLPSYESVRKKDRQRQIHMMIADRFGLNGPAASAEEPPTYEETVRQTLQSLQTQDAPFNPIPPPSRPPLVPPQPMDALPQYEELAHSTTSPDTDNDPQPRDSE